MPELDWFERLTGFRETGYQATREQLEVADGSLRSRVNGRTYGIGTLEVLSLGELRSRAATSMQGRGRLTVSTVSGDVRRMHREVANKDALFQVASQFNLLEMTSPNVTPEQGVTRYAGRPSKRARCLHQHTRPAQHAHDSRVMQAQLPRDDPSLTGQRSV